MWMWTTGATDTSMSCRFNPAGVKKQNQKNKTVFKTIMFHFLTLYFMKRSLILLGAVAATLASCSKSEVVDVNDSKAIGFETFVNKSTRAVGSDEGRTSDNLLEFYVYGGSDKSPNLFVGEKVSRTSKDDPWKYDNIKYWFAGNNYRFAAIFPGAGTHLTANFSYANGGHMELTATLDNDNQYDLVYAEAGPITPEAGTIDQMGAVNFTLGHILSKVRILFEKDGDFGKNTRLQISNIQIQGGNTGEGQGIFGKGKYAYDVNQFKWTRAENAQDVTFSPANVEVGDNAIIGNVTEQVGQTLYVIPQTPADGIRISFSVQLEENADGTWTKVGNLQTKTRTVTVNWAANNVYTYTFKIGKENFEGVYPIDFEASVDTWGTENSSEDLEV